MYLTDFGPGDDLAQGDILILTDSLGSVLADVHPHFLDPKYAGFIVTTQTCDLVRRKSGACKSRYVNLAVVRPLGDVLPDLLVKVCTPVLEAGRPIPGMYLSESRGEGKELLSRIVNQNEQAQGIFYLDSDAGVRIARPSVALLQVSIALRADEHYDTLRLARCGQLTPEFRARLGWLIGNLYSRVATEDVPLEKQEELLSTFLPRKSTDPRDPMWVSSAQVKRAQAAGVHLAGQPIADLGTVLATYAPPPPKELALERVLAVLQEVLCQLPTGSLERIVNRLGNDAVFSSVCSGKSGMRS